MSATLTHAMLADLHTGNASISLLAYSATGLDITSGVDFSAADQIYTLEGSFQLTADDGSNSEVRIDQFQEVIDDQITKGGNWRMVGNIPSTAKALLDYFFTEGAAVPAETSGAVKGVKGNTLNGTSTFYTGQGYLSTPEIIEVSVLVESESRKTAILFAHVKMVVSPIKRDDNNNPAYLSFIGYVLPNPYQSGGTYVGDFAVLKADTMPTNG